MTNWLRRVLHFFKHHRGSPMQCWEIVSAYCPQCGGMTLVREQPSQRISCPQCDA